MSTRWIVDFILFFGWKFFDSILSSLVESVAATHRLHSDFDATNHYEPDALTIRNPLLLFFFAELVEINGKQLAERWDN